MDVSMEARTAVMLAVSKGEAKAVLLAVLSESSTAAPMVIRLAAQRDA